MQIQNEKTLKEPRKFFKSKITVIVAFSLTILGCIFVISRIEPVKNFIKQVSGLIIKTDMDLDFNLFTPLTVVSVLVMLLFVSYYLLRSSYLGTGNKNSLKRRISLFCYWVGHIYVATLEILLYGFIFSIGLTFTLNGRSESALEFLFMPVLLGIAILIIVYILINALFHWLFEKEYGGLMLIGELKWNRELIDFVATLLFIIAIMGSIATLTIKGYEYTDTETKYLFLVFIFTIALYVLKAIKNFTITFLETK